MFVLSKKEKKTFSFVINCNNATDTKKSSKEQNKMQLATSCVFKSQTFLSNITQCKEITAQSKNG